MIKIKERYIVDAEGNRIGVFIDMADYRHLLEQAEELESIRAYDTAKESEDEKIPFDKAVKEIERETS